MDKYYQDLITQKPIHLQGNELRDIIDFVDVETMQEINLAEYQALNLAITKKEKLCSINKRAQQFIDEVAKIDSTPDFERETWQEQEAEAKAWKRDKNAETPVLEIIAKARGIDLEVLREKAYQKSLAYRQISALIAGQRQRYEDLLDKAQTLEDVKAIVPIFTGVDFLEENKNEK